MGRLTGVHYHLYKEKEEREKKQHPKSLVRNHEEIPMKRSWGRGGRSQTQRKPTATLSGGQVPLCTQHALPCVSRTVRKQGPNTGRIFWACSRPMGQQCKTFIWDSSARNTAGVKFGNADGTSKKGTRVAVNMQITGSDSISVSHTPLNETIVSALRNVQDAKYDINKRVWVYPLSRAQTVESTLKSLSGIDLHMCSIPPSVLQYFQKESLNEKARAKAVGGVKKDSGNEEVEKKDEQKLTIETSRIPPNLQRSLLPFQREGVEYVLNKGGKGYIGDEMGLGKTIQAIAVASHFHLDWPLLVICPSSLRLNWKAEFLKWLPSLVSEDDIHVVLSSASIVKVAGKGSAGTTSKRKKSSGSSRILGSCPITIISYDLVSRVEEEITHANYRVVVCDESHYLKNGTAKRTMAILPLIKKASRVVLLSGTPALNRPIELHSQITALHPNLLPSKVAFGTRYCDGRKGMYGWEFKGATNLEELHFILKETSMIRRLKKDVLTQLPAKRRQGILVKVPPAKMPASLKRAQSEESKGGRSLIQRVGDGNAFSADKDLMTMFGESGLAKLPAVIDFIDDMISGETKFLIFAHHRAVLDGIEEAVRKAKVGYIRIDGSTPAETRQPLVDKFQSDPSCLVAVLSITAGGTGLTLTAASNVVFAELHWTPGLLMQAEDRVHRIGQRCASNMYYIVGENTLDDVMWPMISNKIAVLGQTLDGRTADGQQRTDSSGSIGSNGGGGGSRGERERERETVEEKAERFSMDKKDMRVIDPSQKSITTFFKKNSAPSTSLSQSSSSSSSSSSSPSLLSRTSSSSSSSSSLPSSSSSQPSASSSLPSTSSSPWPRPSTSTSSPSSMQVEEKIDETSQSLSFSSLSPSPSSLSSIPFLSQNNSPHGGSFAPLRPLVKPAPPVDDPLVCELFSSLPLKPSARPSSTMKKKQTTSLRRSSGTCTKKKRKTDNNRKQQTSKDTIDLTELPMW